MCTRPPAPLTATTSPTTCFRPPSHPHDHDHGSLGLELGVPGEGVYTWEETKAILALFAVTSSPLILGNDPRPGRMYLFPTTRTP